MAASRSPGQDVPEPVDSSTLLRVGYRPDSAILELTFTTGRVYQYLDVPPRIHAGLMRAESKGRYFNRHIRPRFAYRRLR
jgi:hypothetical protein